MTIGEIAAKTSLPASTLRYYEKLGLIQVDRKPNGQRCYAESDIAWIGFIRRLKETGMKLCDIQKYARLRYAGASTMPERLAMLVLHQQYVLEQQKKWQEYGRNLEEKIAFYKHEIQHIQPSITD